MVIEDIGCIVVVEGALFIVIICDEDAEASQPICPCVAPMNMALYSYSPACGGKNVPLYVPPVPVVILGLRMLTHSSEPTSAYSIIMILPPGTAWFPGSTLTVPPTVTDWPTV